jgi:hypothetical protein
LVKTFEDKHAPPEIRHAAESILQLMVDIMDLASDKGFILDRWTTVVNVMIHKKLGVCLMSKLRVIHLFEADHNFIIRIIFGRRHGHARKSMGPTRPTMLRCGGHARDDPRSLQNDENPTRRIRKGCIRLL